MIDHGKVYFTARDRVRAVLSDRCWHSWRELYEVGGIRYGARIMELRRMGMQIEDEDQHVGYDNAAGKRYRLTTETLGPKQPRRVRVYLDEQDALAACTGYLRPSAGKAIADAVRVHRKRRGCL